MKNLGYANDWGGKTPEIIKECREKKHRPVHTQTMQRCVEMVGCPDCGYYYKIDSSG